MGEGTHGGVSISTVIVLAITALPVGALHHLDPIQCYKGTMLPLDQKPTQTINCTHPEDDMNVAVCNKTFSGSEASYGCQHSRHYSIFGRQCMMPSMEGSPTLIICSCDAHFCNAEEFALDVLPWLSADQPLEPPTKGSPLTCYKGEGLHKQSGPSEEAPCAPGTRFCRKVIFRGGRSQHSCADGQIAIVGCKFTEGGQEEVCFCASNLCNDMNLGSSAGDNRADMGFTWAILTVGALLSMRPRIR